MGIKLRRRFLAVISVLPASLPIAAVAEQVAPSSDSVSGFSDSPRPQQPLPPISPGAPPQPGFVLPPLPAPQEPDHLSTSPHFMLRAVRFEGNKALSTTVLEEIAKPYIGRTVGTDDLEELRRQLTVAYINRGYITSGALLPDQNIGDGTVTYRIIEGKVTDVDVSGTKHLNPGYVRDRLEGNLATPVNIESIEQALQILLRDPNIARLNVELAPGAALGEASLNAEATETPRTSISATIANDQPPNVGSVHGEADAVFRNLIGWGDTLTARYGRTDGLSDGGAAWSVPVLADDTTVGVKFDDDNSSVIDQSFSGLNITSKTQTIGFTVTRPFYRTQQQALTLGVTLDLRDSWTYLLGEPFSFSPGVDNGRARATVLRLSANWLNQGLDQVLALRSTFNVGIDALGATVTPVAPTGKFFSWLGQAQYVRQIFKDSQLVARTDVQLAANPLFYFEQIAIGGANTVRGYRENELVRDNAIISSIEARIPILQTQLPQWAGSDFRGPLELAPFVDVGHGWNTQLPTPSPKTIGSVGVGLRWELSTRLLAQLYYGYAFTKIPQSSYDLQDSGISFRLTTRLY